MFQGTEKMYDESDDLHLLSTHDMLPLQPGFGSLSQTFSFDSDILLSQNMVNHAHLSKPPSLDEVETPFNFEVNLPGEQSGKGTWVYSAELRKVFIKMKQIFTVNISYTKPDRQTHTNLNLRIFPMFTEADDQHHAVQRCNNHVASDSGKPHLLWCNHQSAVYVGQRDKVNYNERLAIMVPMTGNGCEVSESIGLEFHCQNSCTSGINRRSVAMVFVLETDTYDIIGKRIMHFKVCSCPKRDKEKEEEASRPANGSKRAKRERDPSPPASTSRKKPSKIIIKQELPSPPTDEHGNPSGVSGTIIMPNKLMLQKVFEYASSLVADAMVDNPTFTAALEPFRNTLRSQAYEQQQHPDSQGSV